MDWPVFVGVNWTSFVNGFSNHIDNTAESLGSDGDLDGSTGVGALLAADESVGGLHGDGADGVFSEVLGYLEDETVSGGFDFEGVENLGELLVELLERRGGEIVVNQGGHEMAAPIQYNTTEKPSSQQQYNGRPDSPERRQRLQ